MAYPYGLPLAIPRHNYPFSVRFPIDLCEKAEGRRGRIALQPVDKHRPVCLATHLKAQAISFSFLKAQVISLLFLNAQVFSFHLKAQAISRLFMLLHLLQVKRIPPGKHATGCWVLELFAIGISSDTSILGDI